MHRQHHFMVVILVSILMFGGVAYVAYELFRPNRHPLTTIPADLNPNE